MSTDLRPAATVAIPSAQPDDRRGRRRSPHRSTGIDRVFSLVIGLTCLVVVIAALYPLWFVLIASISDPTLVSTGHVTIVPRSISTFGYEQIFADDRIWTGYRNTIVYSVVGTAVNLVVTLPAAFAMSRPEFTARRPLMIFFALTMFFSGGLIPTYLLYRDIGLLNNWLVFILPTALNVFNMIIARSFFENSLPRELFESAALDGADYFRFFTMIALPLSRAVISVIGLFCLVSHWNDFFTGLVFIRDNDKQPLQIILRDILLSNQAFAGGSGTAGGATGGGYAQQYADQIKYGVIIVATLPVIVLYPFLQRYFEKGVMIGSVKG